MRTERIYQEPEGGGWRIEYPTFDKLADEQMNTFWPWNEPDVQNDLQDLRVRLTKAELHGITTTLLLFTRYEMVAGGEYWANRVMKTFKRPEIQRMASMFSAVEMNSHAPFYDQINKVLNLDTPEFYAQWEKIETLRKRMVFIKNAINSDDDLYSLGAFTFIEGAVLFASFGFIKHFQSPECNKDLLKNTNRGINLSVSDENTHAIGSGALFQTIVNERGIKGTKEYDDLVKTIEKVAHEVLEHEIEIIDLIFEEGDIKGITKANMVDFVKHRINVCMEYLGMEPLYDNLDGVIESWFYKGVTNLVFHDFFTGAGSEYHINWREDAFGKVW